jgi:hypothetical protein
MSAHIDASLAEGLAPSSQDTQSCDTEPWSVSLSFVDSSNGVRAHVGRSSLQRSEETSARNTGATIVTFRATGRRTCRLVTALLGDGGDGSPAASCPQCRHPRSAGGGDRRSRIENTGQRRNSRTFPNLFSRTGRRTGHPPVANSPGRSMSRPVSTAMRMARTRWPPWRCVEPSERRRACSGPVRLRRCRYGLRAASA